MISYKMTWNLCGTKNLIWFQAKNNNFILSLNPKRLLKIIIKAEIKLKWKKKEKRDTFIRTSFQVWCLGISNAMNIGS